MNDPKCEDCEGLGDDESSWGCISKRSGTLKGCAECTGRRNKCPLAGQPIPVPSGRVPSPDTAAAANAAQPTTPPATSSLLPRARWEAQVVSRICFNEPNLF